MSGRILNTLSLAILLVSISCRVISGSSDKVGDTETAHSDVETDTEVADTEEDPDTDLPETEDTEVPFYNDEAESCEYVADPCHEIVAPGSRWRREVRDEVVAIRFRPEATLEDRGSWLEWSFDEILESDTDDLGTEFVQTPPLFTPGRYVVQVLGHDDVTHQDGELASCIMRHTDVEVCPEPDPPLLGYLPRTMITVTVGEAPASAVK